MEKIEIEKYQKAFDEIGKVHCTDCVVDFSQDKFYISELEFKGTMDEWKSKINSSWIYERTAKVICSDGNVIQMAAIHAVNMQLFVPFPFWFLRVKLT